MYQWLTSETAFKVQQPQSQEQPQENRLQDSVQQVLAKKAVKPYSHLLKKKSQAFQNIQPMGRGFRNKILGIFVTYCYRTNCTKT